MNASGNTNRRRSPVSLTGASLAGLGLMLAGCNPSGERALVEGDRLLQLGKAGESLPLLERAVQDLPQNAPALNHLGLAYHATGKTNEARRAYLRALEVDRNRIEATYNLAITHLERGELLEAEKGLRAYLVAHPEDTAVWGVLAHLQFQSGRWDDAERSFAAIQPAESIGADGWNTRGVLSLRKRRFKDAINCFQYALSLNPAATTPLFNLGVTLQLQGDRRNAAAYYRKWLASAPPNSQSAAVQELIRQWEIPPAVQNAATITNATVPAIPPKPGRPTPSTQRTNTVTDTARPTTTTTTPTALTAPTTPATAPAIQQANVPANAAPNTPRTPEPTANKPVAPPQITAPAPPPLQVVNVQEDPPLRPAQDVSAAKPTAPPVSAPAVSAPAVTPQAPTTPDPKKTAPKTEEAIPDPESMTDGPTAAKRSLWQRVTPGKWANPVQWFRKDSSTNAAPIPDVISNAIPKAKPTAPSSTPLKKPTPLSAPAASAAPSQPSPAATTVKAAPRTDLVRNPRPAPPRYARRALGLLPAGDRSVAETHFQQGVGAHQRRDLVTAAAQYRRATEVDPTFHEAFHNLALVAMDQGDLSLALLACEQALLIRPSDAETRRNFASALKQARYPQDAAEQIELYLATKPTDSAFHLAAAGLYAGELDDPAKARTHYESVLALEPSHPQAGAIRGWLASHPK